MQIASIQLQVADNQYIFHRISFDSDPDILHRLS